MIGPIPEVLPNGKKPHHTMVGRRIRKRKCVNGHDRVFVGMYGGSCAACCADIQRRRKERGVVPRVASEWCVNGHHKPTTGFVSGSNGCRECSKASQRNYQRRKRSERYDAPVALFGARDEGLKLKPLRESLGLTRADLEALSGVSRFTIVDLERGRSKGYPTTRKKLTDAIARCIAEKRKGRYTYLLLALVEAERRGRPTVAETAKIMGTDGKKLGSLLRRLKKRGLAERIETAKVASWKATDHGRKLLGAPRV